MYDSVLHEAISKLGKENKRLNKKVGQLLELTKSLSDENERLREAIKRTLEERVYLSPTTTALSQY